MKSIALSLVSALAGAAAVLLWHSRFAPDPIDAGPDIAALSRQVTLRDDQLAGLRRELASLKAPPADTTADPNKPPDINRLLNEARPLLRSLSILFGDARRKSVERFINSAAERYAKSLNLTPEQTEAMKAHFLALDEKNNAALQEMLKKEMNIFQVIPLFRDLNPESRIDDYFRTALTPEQAKSWETSKLAKRAEQITSNANRQLDRMSRDLNLSPDQEDKVFQTLVRTDRQYDPALQFEGVAATDTPRGEKLNRDESLAAILTPEQLEKYTASRSRRNDERSGWMQKLGLDAETLGGLAGFGR